MAAQPNETVARSLLDPSRREVLWPSVFAGVKNVVRSNNLNNETLGCIKGWLKSNDSQLHIPLLSLTVLHTISLNCSQSVRNQMATPKLFQRLEKQLAKPQGPQVASAIVQVLYDWTFLYPQEELAARSRALLAPPRYAHMAAACAPSPAVLAMQEEARLGIPPVAPIRGEDFIRWMYRGAADNSRGGNGSVAASAGGGGGSFAAAGPPGGEGLPGGAPPPITTAAVPQLCQRMRTDAQRMTTELSSCRAAAAAGRMGGLTSAMDAAYREAERGSQWRRRVQDYTQLCDDPAALSAVLAATDVINQALEDWQKFSGREVYDTMRIAVPPMLPSAAGVGSAAAAPGQRPGAPAGSAAKGQNDIDVLLGLTPQQAPALRAAAAPFDPFAPQPPWAASPAVTSPGVAALLGPNGNPFLVSGVTGAAASPPSSNPWAVPNTSVQGAAVRHGPYTGAPASGNGVGAASNLQPLDLTDWDPFSPTRLRPAGAPTQASGSVAGSGNLAASSSGAGSSGGLGAATSGWAVFGNESGPTGVTATANGSSYGLPGTGVSGSNPNSPASWSPTPAFASLSSSSTAAAAAAAAAGAAAAQPFGDILATASRATTPQPPTTSATSRPQAPVNGATGTATASSSSPAAAQTAQAQAKQLDPRPPAPSAATVSSAFANPAAANGVYAPLTNGVSGTSITGAALSDSNSTPVNSSSSAAYPPLDWRPEYDRLASDLRGLFSSTQNSPMGPRALQSLLQGVLSRVGSMCEALAAQHAQQAQAARPAAPSATAAAANTATSGSNGFVASATAAAASAASTGWPQAAGAPGGALAGTRDMGMYAVRPAEAVVEGGQRAAGTSGRVGPAAAPGVGATAGSTQQQQPARSHPQPSYRLNGFSDLGLPTSAAGTGAPAAAAVGPLAGSGSGGGVSGKLGMAGAAGTGTGPGAVYAGSGRGVNGTSLI